MTLDRSFVELNRASTNRIRALAASLTDEEMQHPVGEHWTVGIALAHLAWWDRRVMYVLDMTERNGELFVPEIDIFVNDLSLPLWAAIQPRAAARIAIESAETLDQRLESYPPALLEAIYAYNKRWVVRALHRGEHLDEVDVALKAEQQPSAVLEVMRNTRYCEPNYRHACVGGQRIRRGHCVLHRRAAFHRRRHPTRRREALGSSPRPHRKGLPLFLPRRQPQSNWRTLVTKPEVASSSSSTPMTSGTTTATCKPTAFASPRSRARNLRPCGCVL